VLQAPVSNERVLSEDDFLTLMTNDSSSNAPLSFLLEMERNSSEKSLEKTSCPPAKLPKIWDLHVINPQWQELRAQNESTFYLRAAYYDNRFVLLKYNWFNTDLKHILYTYI